ANESRFRERLSTGLSQAPRAPLRALSVLWRADPIQWPSCPFHRGVGWGTVRGCSNSIRDGTVCNGHRLAGKGPIFELKGRTCQLMPTNGPTLACTASSGPLCKPFRGTSLGVRRSKRPPEIGEALSEQLPCRQYSQWP